jgi:hypothetical protein
MREPRGKRAGTIQEDNGTVTRALQDALVVRMTRTGTSALSSPQDADSSMRDFQEAYECQYYIEMPRLLSITGRKFSGACSGPHQHKNLGERLIA